MAPRLSTAATRVMAARPEGWDICEEGRARLAAGEDVIMLATGAPDLPPPAGAVAGGLGCMGEGRLGYPVQQGEPHLRALVADRHAAGGAARARLSDVVVTAGAQHGVLACLQAVAGPGDRVAVLEPRYPGHVSAVAAVGAEAVPFRLGPGPGYRLDPGELPEGVVAVVLSNPHNPTGRVFTRGEILGLVSACLGRGAWLISDEAYADLAFDGPHVPAAAVEGGSRCTLTVGSLSKSHSMPGWRCGWVVAPEGVGPAIQALAACGSLGVPPFVQSGAAAALAAGEDALGPARSAYRSRRDVLVGCLSRVRGLVAPCPEGGMFVFADARGLGMDGRAFARRALDAGVCVMPGEAFGALGRVRIALTAQPGRLVEAAGRLASAFPPRARSPNVGRVSLRSGGDGEAARTCDGSYGGA